MKACQLIFNAVISLVLFSHQAHAQLCSDKIRNNMNLDKSICLAIPVSGWICGILTIPEYRRKAFDIACLDAATVLSSASMKDNKTLNASVIIDKFYSKLEKLYPRMKLGRDEVVNILNDLNVNGVKNGQCPAVYSPHSLAYTFFPDAKAQRYLENALKFEREILEAQKVREQKNSSVENFYYYDLSEDEASKPLLGAHL